MLFYPDVYHYKRQNNVVCLMAHIEIKYNPLEFHPNKTIASLIFKEILTTYNNELARLIYYILN